MMQLTPTQRRALRAQAHSLKPVVMIAENGLSEAVLKEIDRALNSHGLIKVKVFEHDKADRAELLSQAAQALQAAPVQQIGNILVLYRPIETPEPSVSVRKAAPRKTASSKNGPRGPKTVVRTATKRGGLPVEIVKIGTGSKSGTGSARRNSAARPAPAAAARPSGLARRTSPNPPRRANNVRGR